MGYEHKLSFVLWVCKIIKELETSRANSFYKVLIGLGRTKIFGKYVCMCASSHARAHTKTHKVGKQEG